MGFGMRQFTLVELMVVVAITMVLAAIALPQVYGYQMRARKAEVMVNVDGIKTAEIGYEATNDTYLYDTLTCYPVGCASVLTNEAYHPWGNGTAFWRDLGWSPDGEVRAGYGVTASSFHSLLVVPTTCPVSSSGQSMCPYAWGNFEDDENPSIPCASLAWASIDTNVVYSEHEGCIP